MKTVSQILTTIQYKPQFRKILQHKCIAKLSSSLLLSIQNHIKFGYIRDKTLFFVTSATLNRHDIDNNIINHIKMILKSPMILNSEKFLECIDTEIEDVKVFVNHKPKSSYKPFTTSAHKMVYQERASGEFANNIEDEKLHKLVDSIKSIIKDKNES